MRSIGKTLLTTCIGLAAAAGLVIGGAGVASAATATPAAHSTTNWGSGCNPWAREQWSLNGSNTVENNQFSPPYTYSITFQQHGSCLSGTMTDSYYPTTGPIYGTINGNHVTFSFAYPAGSIQGTRTFTGTIQPRWYRQWYQHWVWNGHRWVHRWTFRWQIHGYVSGHWTETGSEGASSTWYLANYARFTW
jgi:hypothetical protein